MGAIDEVKDRIDIVDIVGETVKLRKSGKNYTGFCPFHPNKRTPAFAVFPDSGTWRCFGACSEGGDIFSYVMKKEGWDFSETLAYLAERAGVELEAHTPEQEAEDESRQRLHELLDTTVTFFRHQLLSTTAGEPALAYLRDRGISDATLETFEIGYAPDSWDATMKHLIERGFKERDLVDAGVVSERETGGLFDRFRNRVMFPIRDVRGRMAGFGARVLDPEAVPKYLNSPQTSIFDKGRLLYGLDKSRQEIRKLDQAVIVEGYMDVIGLNQAGFGNAVSPMGTALTENQLRLLKRYSRRIVLALDADTAGSQATLRGLDIARETLDWEVDPVFNARGLVRHEGRLDADLRIVTLPDGLDPDEVVLDDPEAWTGLLEGAQTIVNYVLDVAIAERDIEDPKAKAEIARQVLPLIEDVADPVEREVYRQNLARRLKVDERALLQWRKTKPRRGRRAPQAERDVEEKPAVIAPSGAAERFCLAVLLDHPELLYRVDREFQALEIERSSNQDFSSTEYQMIFKVIRSALGQHEEEPVQYWQNKLETTLYSIAEMLMDEFDNIDTQEQKVIEEVIANFFRLRKRWIESKLTHIRFQLEALQEQSPADGADQRGQMWQLTREVQRLADIERRLDRVLSRHGGPISTAAAL
ncbi:MAG: DNA primase [Anaerolineales bacterium]|nr:DNA primase [Anaerolineales bacterium]